MSCISYQLIEDRRRKDEERQRQERIEDALDLAAERPDLVLETRNMILLLKASRDMIAGLRNPDAPPFGLERSIAALVARVEKETH